jgi:hypothetical protein
LRWLIETYRGDLTVVDNDSPEHLTGTEARAGTTPHVARVALIGGTVLVVIAFVIIVLVGGS